MKYAVKLTAVPSDSEKKDKLKCETEALTQLEESVSNIYASQQIHYHRSNPDHTHLTRTYNICNFGTSWIMIPMEYCTHGVCL